MSSCRQHTQKKTFQQSLYTAYIVVSGTKKKNIHVNSYRRDLGVLHIFVIKSTDKGFLGSILLLVMRSDILMAFDLHTKDCVILSGQRWKQRSESDRERREG